MPPVQVRKWPLLAALALTMITGLLTLPAFAQQGNDTIGISLTAAPTTLVVGEETTLTITLTGQNIPPCTTAVVQPADIVLVMDVSTSMDDEGKLEAAKQAALAFVGQMDLAVHQVALVAFSDTAFTVQGLTQNLAVIQAAIEALQVIDGTDIASGLQEGSAVVRGTAHRPLATPVLVLLSDGQSDAIAAQQAANQAQQNGAVIYTISLGSDADRSLMASLASSPSNYYHAPSNAELSAIYSAIQSQIAAAAVSNLIVQAKINEDALEPLPNGLSPSGVMVGNEITWTIDSLAVGETQALNIRARAVHPGTYLALSAVQVQYTLCDQPYTFSGGPGPTVILVAPPPPPCTQEPLGNECISSIVCLGSLAWPCTVLGLPWWVCLLLTLLSLLALLLWLWWRNKERKLLAWQPRPRGAISPPVSHADEWPPLPQPVLPAPIPVVRSEVEAQIIPTLAIGIGPAGVETLKTLRESLLEAYGAVPANIHLATIDTEPKVDNQDGIDHFHLPLTNKNLSEP